MRSAVLAWMLFFAQVENGQLSGEVRDVLGAALGKADVRIHLNVPLSAAAANFKNREIETSSNNAGKFALVLPPGFYDVCVHAASFSPSCKVIKVVQGAVVDCKMRLDINREIAHGHELIPIEPIHLKSVAPPQIIVPNKNPK